MEEESGPAEAEPKKKIRANERREYNRSKSFLEKSMKLFWKIIGVLLVLSGLVWFLQGINLLPGSYMTGQIQWTVNGGIAMLIGAGLILWSRRTTGKDV